MSEFRPTGLVRFLAPVKHQITDEVLMIPFVVSIRTWKRTKSGWYPVLGTNHPKTNGYNYKALALKAAKAFQTSTDTVKVVSERVYIKDQGFTTLAKTKEVATRNGGTIEVPMTVPAVIVHKALKGSPTRLEKTDTVIDIKDDLLRSLLETGISLPSQMIDNPDHFDDGSLSDSLEYDRERGERYPKPKRQSKQAKNKPVNFEVLAQKAKQVRAKFSGIT